MNIQLSIPTSVLLRKSVEKIVADGRHGNFCVLPRHTDYIALLVPGILVLTDESESEAFFANDHGLLLKRGNDVFISVRRAIPGDSLESLKHTVEDRFVRLDESDRACQTAVASLEANFLRRFLAIQKGSSNA